MTAFRCSAASLERAEAIAGSASTVRRLVLVESVGPWGRDALRDSRLPLDVSAWLRVTTRRLGVRALLIRRPGRRSDPGVSVFAASMQPTAVWMERLHLESALDLPAIDLAPLAEGRSLGWEPYEEPLFLVCTHGRHDACCAEKGRPVAAELAQVEPDATWEVSHIGGDRFAGNVLVLPHGLYYGRVEPDDAAQLAASHRAGRLDLDHLRGRTCYPFDVQAAEVYLRRRLDVLGQGDVVWSARRSNEDLSEISFRVGDRGDWRVVIRRGAAAATQLTCAARTESAAPTFELVSVDRSGA